MDNDKINSTLFAFLVVFVILFGVSLYFHTIKNKELDTYIEYKVELEALKDNFNKSQEIIDSLNIVVNKKEATIINNTYVYEKDNRKIGSANRTVTDSLFKANLQSDYIKYRHLITN